MNEPVVKSNTVVTTDPDGTKRRKKHTRVSTVIVKKLDTSTLGKAMWRQWKEENPDKDVDFDTFDFGWDIGRIDTTEGTFILCTEGVGGPKPLEEEPYEIGVYPVWSDKDSFAWAPIALAHLKPEHVGDLPYTEVNLADFIRKFGERLEGNFNLWNNRLSPIVR